MALGEVDYGLMGVIGGLMTFVAFLNGLMAASISRFYAFSVGRAKVAKNASEGIEECRRWFSLALGIHTVIPVVLLAIGYPLGIAAIKHFLTVPQERIADCIWVWRFTCLSGFVAMINVPFAAMYNAKQEIAELTFYSIATTTLNVIFLRYMVTHPRVWLARFSFWTCMLSVVPQSIICWRAIIKYPECRFRKAYFFDRKRLWEVVSFSANRAITSVSTLLSSQGLAIVVNKYLGPTRNAAMSIGNTVVGHTSSLSASINGAFSPAITNAAGEGNLNHMRKLALCACKFSTLSAMMFVIPLSLEIKEVVTLWLKKPPEGVVVIALFLLYNVILDRLSNGHYMCIVAMGKIRIFMAIESIWFFVRFCLGWSLVALGLDLLAIGIAYAATGFASVLNKLWFGHKLCGLSPKNWCKEIVVPIGIVFVATFALALIPRFFLRPSFYRVIVTVVVSELTFLPLTWMFVLQESERTLISNKLKRVLQRKGR